MVANQQGADLIHAGLTARFGMGQLGIPSKSGDGSFVVYDWSVGLAIGPSTFLIRDATDEIALPMAQHKHPPSVELGFGEECAGRVQRLIGHYYICSFRRSLRVNALSPESRVLGQVVVRLPLEVARLAIPAKSPFE